MGMAADPMDEKELASVNEATATPRALKVVPTFASVAAWGAGPGEMNLNRVMVVDGERDITFHRPLAVAAHITADSSVLDVFDKGKHRHAVIRHTPVLRNEKGEDLATLVASRFARGDGGFGGPSEGQPEPHKVPTRAPDKTVDISTRPDQALVYRLCGDRNPLHSDPEFAKKAGFPKPILHGMCTYGITCRGVLQTYADYDPSAFKQHAVRFSSPVYPGETVTMAQKVVNAIKEEGGRAVANGSDISTIAGGQSVFDDAIKNFGRADILVNNAGILLDETFAKAKEANWDRVIKVHLKGTFCCTQPVFKWMRENGGGVIVNTSSTSGLIGNFGQTNYGAAKGGIWGLSNVLAIEGRKYNIRIWTLAPGALTRMTADLPRYKDNPGAALCPDGIAPPSL